MDLPRILFSRVPFAWVSKLSSESGCPDNERVLWVGAGTRDTGLSLTRLSFQITHATDSDTNAERDHVIAKLTKSRAIGAAKVHQAGQDLLTEHDNRYVTDGEIALASLVVKDPR